MLFAPRVGTFAAINGNGQTYTPSYSPTGVALIAGSGGNAEVGLTTIDSPDPATVGAALVYGLTILNNGPGTAASVDGYRYAAGERHLRVADTEPG